MRVLILGCDGYIGWPLTLHLLKCDYEVYGLDTFTRRKRVNDIGSNSITPIASKLERNEILRSYPNFPEDVANIDMLDYENLGRLISYCEPDAIIHLAEQPSASWSMRDAKSAMQTQFDNVIGTLNLLWEMKEYCPDAHLIKLSSIGEYGTPDCGIPEGEIEEICSTIEYHNPHIATQVKCPMSGLSFPRSPGSFYHLSEVHNTHNIIFACKAWGLQSTNIMQGVVFGLSDEEEDLLTRLDYDEHFGTVINRFCAQAIIGHPLTVYGKGGQTRGFLSLKDSIQYLTFALGNPSYENKYRTLNQFEFTYTINGLAQKVVDAAKKHDIDATIQHINNPRTEAESHYYNPAHQKLFNIGYGPTKDIDKELENLIENIKKYKDRIISDVIMPKTDWRL